MADIVDKMLNWYAAKSLAEILSEGGTDDQYRARTEEQRADNLLREISQEADALEADRERLDWLDEEMRRQMKADPLGLRTRCILTSEEAHNAGGLRAGIDKRRSTRSGRGDKAE